MVLAAAMFGMSGLIKHYFTAPAGFVAMTRGFGGCLTLALIMLLLRKKPDLQAVRRNFLLLMLSGMALGVNWLTLFLSFEDAGVGTATLLDYMAPILVVLLAPLIFKEKIGWKRGLIALLSFLGIAMVAGVFSGAVKVGGEHYVRGLLFGLAAAATYAAVLILNKKMKDVSPFDRGVVQLFFAGAVMVPYVLLKEAPEVAAFSWDTLQVLLFLYFMIVQTGIVYAIFYTALSMLPVQKASLLTYIDPVVTVLLAAIVLREPMDVFQIIGSVLIVLASILLEVVR